jgi:hypothetical protein
MPRLPVMASSFDLPVTGLPNIPPVIPAPVPAIPRVTNACRWHWLVTSGWRRVWRDNDYLGGRSDCGRCASYDKDRLQE